MATLKTRIQLKYDTLANWSKTDVAGKGGNLVLKAGEVGIVQVPTGATAEQTTPPAVLMKVGDGSTAFKDLPWVSGAAADVYPWAKAATKPSYNYSEIKNTLAKNGKLKADECFDSEKQFSIMRDILEDSLIDKKAI